MDKELNLEIVSPLRLVFSGKVKSVTAPGQLGEFQVLYNHAPLVSILDIGKIKIESVSGENKEFSTSGGIFEVRDNKITILAETIESKEDMDLDRARRALERAEQRLKGHEQGLDRARRTLERAEQRLKGHEQGIDSERARLAYRRAKNRLKLMQ